jgi:hypothetical protein
MNGSATVGAGKTTEEVRPHDDTARLFGARRADPGFIPCQPAAQLARGPRKLPEPPGGGSKGRVIWGIPASLYLAHLVLVAEFLGLPKGEFERDEMAANLGASAIPSLGARRGL